MFRHYDTAHGALQSPTEFSACINIPPLDGGIFAIYFTKNGGVGVGVTCTTAERFGILKNGVPV